MIEDDDRALLTAVRQHGDERAFRILYGRHTPILYRVAARLTVPWSESPDDLVHDTWVRASERWDAFEWRSAFRTWLTGILLNRIREGRRRNARDRTVPLSPLLPSHADRLPAETRLDLEHAMARLPDGYRAVIVLHDIEGYAHAEIGALLGIDAGTSKSQLSRARRRLRGWLEPGWKETS